MNAPNGMQRYVLGFIFSPAFDKVLLIEKRKPQWQKGKLNGVGGKIELFETHYAAMEREVFEEVGLRILAGSWNHRLVLQGDDWLVHVFATTSPSLSHAVQRELERPIIVPLDKPLPSNIIPNLRWMIPLLIDGSIAPIIMIQHAFEPAIRPAL